VRRAPVARCLRAALLALIAALYVVSIPWYRSANAPASVWLGLPDWVAVALLCYAAVAVLNSIAWLLTDVPDRGARGESERR
jgi:hypothetical protein